MNSLMTVVGGDWPGSGLMTSHMTENIWTWPHMSPTLCTHITTMCVGVDSTGKMIERTRMQFQMNCSLN